MKKQISTPTPNPATPRPVMLDAVDMTIRTVEGRAGLYRNLLVAVCVASVLSILMAVLFRQWMSLAGLVLLVPLTGGFLFLDGRLVRRWRAGIVEMERSRSLDVPAFLQTISGFRYLPPDALKEMLSTIHASREENRQRGEAIVGGDFDARHRKTELKILCCTGFLTVALVCLIAGAFYRSLALLLSGGSLIILLGLFGRR